MPTRVWAKKRGSSVVASDAKQSIVHVPSHEHMPDEHMYTTCTCGEGVRHMVDMHPPRGEALRYLLMPRGAERGATRAGSRGQRDLPKGARQSAPLAATSVGAQPAAR